MYFLFLSSVKLRREREWKWVLIIGLCPIRFCITLQTKHFYFYTCLTRRERERGRGRQTTWLNGCGSYCCSYYHIFLFLSLPLILIIVFSYTHRSHHHQTSRNLLTTFSPVSLKSPSISWCWLFSKRFVRLLPLVKLRETQVTKNMKSRAWNTL